MPWLPPSRFAKRAASLVFAGLVAGCGGGPEAAPPGAAMVSFRVCSSRLAVPTPCRSRPLRSPD